MVIVLVGASNDKNKFGNIILHNLISKGHTVIPVNPKKEYISGIKAFGDISEIKQKFDVINFVTQCDVTLKVLKQANDLGYKKVWCQPGSSNEQIKRFLEDNNFDYIVDSCIMIEKIN